MRPACRLYITATSLPEGFKKWIHGNYSADQFIEDVWTCKQCAVLSHLFLAMLPMWFPLRYLPIACSSKKRLTELLTGSARQQGRAAEAIACYEHVALLQADSAEAHANLASCYKDAARQDAAITSYRRALALRPDFPEAFANLVHSLQCVCEWRDRPALFQRMEVEVRG